MNQLRLEANESVPKRNGQVGEEVIANAPEFGVRLRFDLEL